MLLPTLSRIVVLSAISHCLFAQPRITAPDATVGRNLQTPITVRLPDTKGRQDLKVTITSSDPRRLLLSDAPDKAGSPSIVVTVLHQFIESPMFWLQGRADKGAVTYTVSAEGFHSVKGIVKLAPSAIVIVGPFRSPKFPITLHAQPSSITIVSAALNKDGKIDAEQPLAAGRDVEVSITNSNPAVGRLRSSTLTLHGGASYGATLFEPLAEGETTLTPTQPTGFQAANEYPSVTAAVSLPGMAIDGEMLLGKDLQNAATLLLGEVSPHGGLEVTLTSSDPSKLVLATRPDEAGCGSIKVTVPEGQFTAAYFLQALGDSGIVTYEAQATGYRNRVARVGLAPSGVIVAYAPYGPPDRAAVVRKVEVVDDRAFHLSLANPKDKEVQLVVWTAYLDPETGRAADITVQPLRPGVKATVNLVSSDPAVGVVQSPLTIDAGKNHAISSFTALRKGVTIISVDAPPGFATPKNATRIPANVNE
jgi:hypothetical protein